MDAAHHSPPDAQPERHGSFNYDIESTDGPWRGAGAGQDRSSEALLRYDDDGPRQPLLRKRTLNTTSQIAIVGANVCPIESLDYEYALHINRLLCFSPSVAPLLDTVNFPKALCSDSAKMFDLYSFLVVIATEDLWVFSLQRTARARSSYCLLVYLLLFGMPYQKARIL